MFHATRVPVREQSEKLGRVGKQKCIVGVSQHLHIWSQDMQLIFGLTS